MGRNHLIAALLATASIAGPASAGEWSMPKIAIAKDAPHPRVACTAAELARLKAAWKGAGREKAVVAAVIARADKALAAPPVFPPRGGQHNQWYQCDRCQIALRTVDPAHHKCPKCGTVYSGEPYDDVIFEHQHYENLRNAQAAAWAHAVTGDRKYADFAAAVLLGYAERYRQYPYHDAGRRTGEKAGRSGGHLFEQTLNEAAEMTGNIAPAFDLIHDALTAPQRQAIREGLLEPMLANIAGNKAGKSNWQTWHNAAFIWGGGALGDEGYIRRAIADPANGFAYQMTVSVMPEGMWYENSWGYHFYTLSAMVQIAEGSRRLGIDLWSHPVLRRMFTLPARYAMPDGSLPRFGDDVRSTVAQAASPMEPAWNACREPAMEASLPAGPTWSGILFGRQTAAARKPAPPAGSEVFPGAGHAILRTAGPAGLAACITFGPYGGFHGHYDKLSFVFFGHGRELGVDPGRAASQAYRLPIHGGWYKATISHNAVLVDGASQKPAAGKLLGFAATEARAAAVASCDEAYGGIRHTRLLAMAGDYLLVADVLRGEKPQRFDWLYHNRGKSAQCEAAKEPGELDPAIAGRQYIQTIRAGKTDGPIRVQFADGDVTTHLTIAAASAGTEVRTGDGVGESVVDRVPIVLVTRRGQAATFVAVLEPVKAGAKPVITDLAAEPTPDGGLSVTLRRGQAADTVTLSPDGRATIGADGKVILSTR